MEARNISKLLIAIFCFIIAGLCFVYSTIFLAGYIDMVYINPVPVTTNNFVNQVGIYVVPLMYAFGYIFGFLLLGASVNQYKQAGGLSKIS